MEANLNYILNFIFSNIEYILGLSSSFAIIYYLIKRKLNEVILYPNKKFEIEKNDLEKINLKLIVYSRDDILENILFNLRKIFDDKPVWIKFKKSLLSYSKITDDKKQLYSISLIGEKGSLKEFLKSFKSEILKEDIFIENKDSLDKPETLSLDENVNVKNLEIKNSNWLIKLLLGLFAFITIFLLAIRVFKKKISKEEAISLASKHLEEISGKKPKVINSYIKNGKHYVIFDNYTVILEKSGNIIEVRKNG
jgi:ribosomal protein S21